MSASPSLPPADEPAPRRRRGASLLARGEPLIWLTGGMLAVAALMIVGLLGLVFWEGLSTFWPRQVVHLTLRDGRVFMGEPTREEDVPPGSASTPRAERPDGERGERPRRLLLRTGNYDLTGTHFQWIDRDEIAREERPRGALVVERLEWGRFYGFPRAFLDIVPLDAAVASSSGSDGRAAARRLIAEAQAAGGGDVRLVLHVDEDGVITAPVEEVDTAPEVVGVARVFEGEEAAWEALQDRHGASRVRWRKRRRLERIETGKIHRRQEEARLEVKDRQLDLARAEAEARSAPAAVEGARERLAEAERHFEEVRSAADGEFARIQEEIARLRAENGRHRILLGTAGAPDQPARDIVLTVEEIVRAYPANALSAAGRGRIYLSRWVEFLTGEPREANSEGGVYPAIFGTVAMTLIMSIIVVPFGVLAALYLREYARGGLTVSIVRVAVNNLAGVPSIVFGVFGLGFFCYVVGASLDQVLFAASLPNPTYGKGGLLWASLTLALLTLPVVIVATEESLAAVPNSLREGSYACGASKWQTIRRIVLPRAMPGVITGMILAIARGAGEVAPLMLVGAVKLAPELPVDGTTPFIHPERSFMHLGFHIYDVGFQSQNSEAAKPMVFTTTLLLIAIVAILNLAAVTLRSRLRRRLVSGHF